MLNEAQFHFLYLAHLGCFKIGYLVWFENDTRLAFDLAPNVQSVITTVN